MTVTIEQIVYEVTINEEIIQPAVVEQEITVVTVAEQGPQGPPGSSNTIIGEVPLGAINGSNATFVSQFAFVPESVELFVNGLRQHRPQHFNTQETNIILLSESPGSGEVIQVNYQRA